MTYRAQFMAVILSSLPLGLLGYGYPSPVYCGNESAKILIDLQQPNQTYSSPCNVNQAQPCSAANLAGDLAPGAVYRSALLLITDGDAASGLAGVACALNYDGQPGSGVDILQWTSCANGPLIGCGLTAPCWEAGQGVILTWDAANSCQRSEPHGPGTGVVAVAGYFYLAAYSPDTLAVVPHATYGQVRVIDCSLTEVALDIRNLGTVVFSQGAAVPGYNPCLFGTPIRPSTWGGVKSLY